MTDIIGIKIKTNIRIATIQSIGLYSVSNGNSEFRYSENVLTGVPEKYSTGFLVKDEIPDLSESGSFIHGGCVVDYGQITIKIKNTQRLNSIIESMRINLIGAIVEIIEFIGTEDDSDSEETTILYNGVCEKVSFTETTIFLSLVPNRGRSRKANLMKITENNINIPVTFGKSSPNDGYFFKSIKTTNVNNSLRLGDIVEYFGDNYAFVYPVNVKLFPAEKTNYLTEDKIKLKMYNFAYTISDDLIKNNLIGKYLLCKEGDPENVGKYRQIKDVDVYPTSEFTPPLQYKAYCVLTLEEFFPVYPSGNDTATAENQSWFEIVDIQNEFEADYIECQGFYDSDADQPILKGVEVYIKNEDEMKKVNIVNSIKNIDNNSFSIYPSGFESSPDNLNNFSFYPIPNLWMYNKNSFLSEYNYSEMSSSSCVKLAPGVIAYKKGPGANGLTHIIQGPTISYSEAYKDLLASSKMYHEVSLNGYPKYWIVFAFTLPVLPKNFTFDKAYLVLDVDSRYEANSGCNSNNFIIMRRSYLSRINTIITANNAMNNIILFDMPDFYYNDQIQTKNEYFYTSKLGPNVHCGYKNFDLKIKDRYDYDSIDEMVLVIFRNDETRLLNYKETTIIREMGICFESNVPISKEIYI